MGSGGSSTMLAYEGSLDRRPSHESIMHVPLLSARDCSSCSTRPVDAEVTPRQDQAWRYNDASGLPSACCLPLQMMWQSLSCVMTGSHVAIRAWSCSSRLGSTFLQKDLELLQLGGSGSVLGKLVNNLVQTWNLLVYVEMGILLTSLLLEFEDCSLADK